MNKPELANYFDQLVRVGLAATDAANYCDNLISVSNVFIDPNLLLEFHQFISTGKLQRT
jgi:hypothetical protein